MTAKLKRYKYILMGAALSLFIYSCASMGAPSGGDYDLDPPVVVRTTPAFNATNTEAKKIVIEFDEFVQIDKPSERVIITPPQRQMPVIQAINKKITVQLKDTLLPNTTYTIDFTDAIGDNNENNLLENFAFSFSTGDVIDSLMISGKVLSAQDLEPIKNIYVGIHSDLDDSAFVTKKFDRISKTNESGIFTIKGIAEGKYRLYALGDINRDYTYDNPAEEIAFLDSLIVPSFESAVREDSIFKGDHTFDSLRLVEYTKFLPNDIVLRSFFSPFKRQYLQKHERPIDNKISLYFGAPTEMPHLAPLNFTAEDWDFVERNVTNDTVHYWIKDPAVAGIDTLSFAVSYLKTDSLNMPVSTTDTLNFINRQKKQQLREIEKRQKEIEKKLKKGDSTDMYDYLAIAANLNSVWEVNKKGVFEFSEPLVDFDPSIIRVQEKKDSLYFDLQALVEPDSLNPRKYVLNNKWEFGKEYRVMIDSAATTSLFGKWNKLYKTDFKIKPVEDYGHLFIEIKDLDSIPAFVELLSEADKPIRKARVIDSGALFMNLNPGKYYARITLDLNENGVWDPGNYDEKKQAEEVIYNDRFFDIKANWEVEESWSIRSLPFDKQKPLDITKNKPEKKESRREQLQKQEEKENARTKRRNEQQKQNQNLNRNGSTNTQNYR